jgi:TonB family protein
MKTLVRFLVFSFAVSASLPGAPATPLRIEQTVEPRFPHALSLSTITEGEARVVVNIDADGKLVDCLVTGYTDKSFADEAVNVLKQWRYVAPTENGQPFGIRTELRFEFEAKGRVVSLTAIETPEILLKQMGIGPRFIAAVYGLQDLDKPVAPINPTSPLYPAQPDAETQRHSVVVDFFVDESGQPRMPVVVNSSHDHFSHAAVDALNSWRFTAPTRGGRPVSVRVRQEFIFPGRS